jgi:hypothetical protein
MLSENVVTIFSPHENPPHIKDISKKLAKWDFDEEKKMYVTTIRLSHLGIYQHFRDYNELGLLNSKGEPFEIKESKDPYNLILNGCIIS